MPLELDGNKRCSPNPLHALKLLLKRKVLTVFSMYTLQFYYYEINECILISTLKTWIKRDTKIETADQLILVNDKISDLPSDDELLINALPEVSTIIEEARFLYGTIQTIQRVLKLVPQNKSCNCMVYFRKKYSTRFIFNFLTIKVPLVFLSYAKGGDFYVFFNYLCTKKVKRAHIEVINQKDRPY